MIGKEKGFSVINLAVAIAIAAIVAAGAGMTSIHIIRSTERNENHAKVVQQAQNLGRWFSRDAIMADNITAGDNPETGDDEEFITLYWKDWESGETFDIRYLWFDDVDSLKRIKRNLVMRDKEGDIIENFTSLIGYGISSANISQQDTMWILSVETHSGQKSTVKEYKVTKRLG